MKMPFVAALLAGWLLFTGQIQAQTPVEFPYNPDFDGDDFIGVLDLVELLALYETTFSEENLYLSEDSAGAVINLGQMAYPQCAYQCSNLPGKWRVALLEDLGMVWDSLMVMAPGSSWLGGTGLEQEISFVNASPISTMYYPLPGNQISVALPNHCLCAIREMKPVEVSYCIGYYPMSGSFELPCVDEKLSEGWLLLGGLSISSGKGTQTFWRWAQ
jgi:hypothetical protein